MGFTINNDVLEKYTEENGVTEVVIPNGVKIIGEGAFENCCNIERVVIPDGVKEIRKFAFYNCSSLLDISFPKSVAEIGDEAFYNTSWLWKKLNKKTLLVINGVLIKANAKGETVIPQGVKKIANYAFYGCSELTSITIPESVESIGTEAFRFCKKLTCLTLASDNGNLIINSKNCIVNEKGEFNVDTKNLLDFVRVDLQEKEHIFNETTDFGCKVMFAVFLAYNYKNKTAEDFIEENTVEAVKYLTDIDDSEDIQKILNYNFMIVDEINELIDYAYEKRKTKIRAMLSKYKNDTFNMKCLWDKLFLD